ncbi:MAG: hypothetical protein NDI69_12260 [Bacteriovoracaceae bacterium]|nr:hypothetical protein [Bacteriovoracaceae bacterium]
MKINLLLLLLAFNFTACDSKGRPSRKNLQRTHAPVENALRADEGERPIIKETYLATLTPLNQEIAGKTSGAVTIHLEGDFLAAHVRVLGSAPNVIHAQNVHIDGLCPTETADANLDGIIDIVEANHFTGPILIPLDGDINSQYSLLGMYPVADTWGSYIYSQTASLESFLQDMKMEDEDPLDDIVKLREAVFNLDGRVVMIHGVADELDLPETAAGKNDLSGAQTLPIACGRLKRVWTVPGRMEDDDRTVGRTRIRPPADAANSGSTNSGDERGTNGTSGDVTGSRQDGPSSVEDREPCEDKGCE